MSDMVERVARAIVKAGGDDPDALLRWPDPDPCWKGAIPEAKAAIAAMQADVAPDAWMPIETAPKDGTFILLHEVLSQPPVSVGCYDHECGWLIAEADFMPSRCSPRHWMPLPAAPVDDRASTPNPVVAHEPGNTSDKLRDAVEVWKDAYEAWCNPPPHLAFSESAAAVIEADRAALVAEIVAWLRQPRTGMGYVGQHLAEQIEAKWGKA